METDHREGGGASTVLRLHHLVSTELDPMGQCLHILLGELSALDLGEEGQDGGARVAADHRHASRGHRPVLVLSHKCVRTDHVKSRDTKQFSRLINA